MKLYLAGPMSGIKDHNFPAFMEAAERLRTKGHEVINPAELDAGEVLTHPWDYYLRRDLKKLVECDVVAVLSGWQHSKGAKLELSVARQLGMLIVDAYSLSPFNPDLVIFPKPPILKSESILEEAQRLVGGDRGKSYGHPFLDMSRTGRIWAAILGLEEVTAAQVALCMVGVKISREVNSPKRDNRTDGAGYFLCLDMIREKEEA